MSTDVIGVVVVTHGQLATELLNAAEAIVGDLPRFAAVSVGWHDDTEDAREEIRQAVARLQGECGVLLLTDMFGGTPTNIGLSFVEPDRVEVVTGVNLPMLIKLSSLRSSGRSLLEVARDLRETGRNAIQLASDLLRADTKA
jgi:mannose PTS system EIIA component